MYLCSDNFRSQTSYYDDRIVPLKVYTITGIRFDCRQCICFKFQAYHHQLLGERIWESCGHSELGYLTRRQRSNNYCQQ